MTQSAKAKSRRHCPFCEQSTIFWEVGDATYERISVKGFRDLYYLEREHECQSCGDVIHTAEIEKDFLDFIVDRLSDEPPLHVPANEVVKSWRADLDLISGRLRTVAEEADALTLKIDRSLMRFDHLRAEKKD